jgi:hypothetical protein
MSDHSIQKRVLALDVHPRSFGYVVFEGPNRLLDWGVRSFRFGVNAVKRPVGAKVARESWRHFDRVGVRTA